MCITPGMRSIPEEYNYVITKGDEKGLHDSDPVLVNVKARGRSFFGCFVDHFIIRFLMYF